MDKTCMGDKIKIQTFGYQLQGKGILKVRIICMIYIYIYIYIFSKGKKVKLTFYNCVGNSA